MTVTPNLRGYRHYGFFSNQESVIRNGCSVVAIDYKAGISALTVYIIIIELILNVTVLQTVPSEPR